MDDNRANPPPSASFNFPTAYRLGCGRIAELAEVTFATANSPHNPGIIAVCDIQRIVIPTTSTHTVDLTASATITVDNITADDIVNAAESGGSINVTGTWTSR